MAGEVLTSNSLVPTSQRIGGVREIIPHAGTTASADDLHSIALLAAMKLVSGFAKAAENLSNLIPLIFDPNLYKYVATDSRTNFMELLVRGQTGIGGETGSQLLEKFTADMTRLAAVGGRLIAEASLNKALIAFGIQAYYLGDNTFAGEVFESVGGGLKIDIDKVAGSLGENKGYLQYFQSWFWPQVGGDEARLAYGAQLANADDWYIGGDRLIADAGANGRRAFMLGAGEMDSLTGGTQADLLVGLGGNDMLSGGQGNDALIGGDGFDTYLYRVGDGNDRIIDSDKQGRILVTAADGKTFHDIATLIQDKDTPNLWVNADGQVRMTHDSTWQLRIGGDLIEGLTDTDDLQGGGDNDRLLGGTGDGGTDRPAIYLVRHIDAAWPPKYPAGMIMEGDAIRPIEGRSLSDVLFAVSESQSWRDGTSAGRTAANAAWRMAA